MLLDEIPRRSIAPPAAHKVRSATALALRGAVGPAGKARHASDQGRGFAQIGEAGVRIWILDCTSIRSITAEKARIGGHAATLSNAGKRGVRTVDPSLWLIVGVAALAGFVQGLSGFGFSLVALSIWAWALDPMLAAVLTVAGGFTGQVIAAVTLRRALNGPA